MIRRLLAAIVRLFSEPASRTPPARVPDDPYRWSVDALPPVEDWAYAVLDAWSDECEDLQGITFWLDVDVIEVENLDTDEVQLLDLARVESAIDDLRSWPGTVTFRTHAPECLPPMPVVFQYRC